MEFWRVIYEDFKEETDLSPELIMKSPLITKTFGTYSNLKFCDTFQDAPHSWDTAFQRADSIWQDKEHLCKGGREPGYGGLEGQEWEFCQC